MFPEHDRVLKILQTIITRETVTRAMEELREADNAFLEPRLRWYMASYPTFCQLFLKTRGSIAQDAWVKRVACVFSWIVRIPTPTFDIQAIKKLTTIERVYGDLRLWEVGFESYLGGQGDPDRIRHHGEVIFGADFDHPPIVLRDFLEPATLLLNSSSRWDQTLPSSTKLLHFMCPTLLPIFDSRIAALIGASHSPNYALYHAYVFAVQTLLTGLDSIRVRMEKAGMNPLRTVDWILFTASL